MGLPAKLTMRCTIQNPGPLDDFGERGAGAVTTDVPCFAFGSNRRIRTSQNTEVTMDFEMLFLPQVSVDLESVISNVIDKRGQLIFERGVVMQIERVAHPRRGQVVTRVFVVRT